MIKTYYDIAKELKLKVKGMEHYGNATLRFVSQQIDEQASLIVQIDMNSI